MTMRVVALSLHNLTSAVIPVVRAVAVHMIAFAPPVHPPVGMVNDYV
jgi:hypothetical protein